MLIVEAAFATLEDAAFRRMETLVGTWGASVATPLLTVQLPWRAGFSLRDVQPVVAATQIHTPTLVIGGERDPRAPVSETTAIYDALPANKELWIVPGASHHNMHRFAPEAWEARVTQFLAESSIISRSQR